MEVGDKKTTIFVALTRFILLVCLSVWVGFEVGALWGVVTFFVIQTFMPTLKSNGR